MAADPGFEPGFRVPETRVLPLHQSALMNVRANILICYSG